MPFCVLHPFPVVHHAVLCLLLTPVVQFGTLPTQEPPPSGQIQEPHPLATSRAEEKGLLSAESIGGIGQGYLLISAFQMQERITFIHLVGLNQPLPTPEATSPMQRRGFKAVYAGSPLYLFMGLIPAPIITTKIHAFHFFLLLCLNILSCVALLSFAGFCGFLAVIKANPILEAHCHKPRLTAAAVEQDRGSSKF